MCSLSLQISPASKNRAPIHHYESAKSIRPGQSLNFSPRHGHCVVFWGKFFWKCLVLGNLTCAQIVYCTVCAWAVFGIIQWMSVFKMIAFTTQHGGIEVPERTSDCPEPNTFKNISLKTQRNAHDLALRIWRSDDGWIGARFFDAERFVSWNCTQSPALLRFTTPKKQRAAKQYKVAMNWAQVTQKNQQQTQVSLNYNLFLYLGLYFYVWTTILNFSYKVFKSFIICKPVSKLAVIYASSLGRL